MTVWLSKNKDFSACRAKGEGAPGRAAAPPLNTDRVSAAKVHHLVHIMQAILDVALQQCTERCLTVRHREQLKKVQAELKYTSNKCNALSQENNLLREHSTGSQSQAETKTDPLAEQVAPYSGSYIFRAQAWQWATLCLRSCRQHEKSAVSPQVAAQLQALLQEKAKLAIENARLAHENTSLQVKHQCTSKSLCPMLQ